MTENPRGLSPRGSLDQHPVLQRSPCCACGDCLVWAPVLLSPNCPPASGRGPARGLLAGVVQGSNGETDIENRLMDMERGEERRG